MIQDSFFYPGFLKTKERERESWLLPLKNAGILSEAFSHNSFCESPDRFTISTSEIEPSYNVLKNVIAPEGAMPTKPL